MKRKGIDVSYAQGVIDWEKTAADPSVEFAMLRATASYPHGGKKGIDLQWERNIYEAEKTGLPLGAYHYSYALNKEEAHREAEHFLKVIQGHRFAYPVALDFEDPIQSRLSPQEMADICYEWLTDVKNAGYYAMLYSTASWLKYKLTDPRLQAYDKWVAHVEVEQPMLLGGMWQYSWRGKVWGISGDTDLNYAYKDFPAIIKGRGLNGWGSPERDYQKLYEQAQSKLDRIALIVDEP